MMHTRILPVLALAGFVLFLVWESIRPFFPFFVGNVMRRGQHFVRNVGVGIVNAAGVGLLFVPWWGYISELQYGLLHRIPMPVWLHTLLAILLLDCWTYWWHRANHEIAFLWRFHRMHHTDPHMDVTTARRFHPGEILFSSILRLPLIFVLGIHLWELLLYGAIMGVIVDFHHANIALPERVDRWLRMLIVTPAMHKVHHSILQPETDSNYTSLLSVWDRLFGTFRLRPDPATIEIGLDDWRDPAHQTIKGLIKTPFVQEHE